jgi:hypothetical protein
MSMLILVGYYLVKGMAIRLTEKMHYGVTVLSNILVPAEVASVMPVAMAEPMQMQMPLSSPAESAPAPQPIATTQGAPSDANVADAVVQDVKDEEEII